jgi:predicted YcjX-like family ATPase
MKDELLKQLLDVAQRRAILNGFRFNSLVNTELENFMRAGINRLTNKQLKSDTLKNEAANNVEELVDLMIQNAHSRRLTDSLDISTLNISLRNFCPRFPFC